MLRSQGPTIRAGKIKVRMPGPGFSVELALKAMFWLLVLVAMCRWAEKGWLEIFVTRAKGLDQFLIRNT